MPLTLRIESELDERSATAAADRAQRIYANAAQDMSRSMSEGLTRGARDGGRAVEQMATDAQAAYQRVGQATDEVTAQQRQLNQMREEGARGVEVQAERVRRAKRQEREAIREAAAAYDEYERAANNAASAGENAGAGFLGGMRGAAAGAAGAGQEFAEGFAGGFAGSGALLRLSSAAGPVGMALAGLGALGFVAGSAIVSQVEAGMASMATRDLFRTRLGVDESTMNQLGSAAGDAFANGWGASVGDNLRTLQFGIQGGLIDAGASEAQSQQLIEQMNAVAAATEADAQEIARGTRNMISTGLVGTYEEAFDLLIAANAQGLNLSDDLFDTMEEYGTKFRDLGLSGAEALGLVNQMWEGGARNVDVAADALKEFAITVTDNSESTRDAFAALGFNADEMNARFVEGGAVARQSLGEILTALQQLDAEEREQVGLALFKTKWEDMGDAIDGVDLNAAATELGNIDGAARNATTALSEHQSQWTLLGNNIDVTFGKLQEWLADSAIGRFFGEGLPGFLNDLTAPPGFNLNPEPPAPGTPVTQNPLLGPYQPSADAAPIGGMAGTNPLDIFAPTTVPPGALNGPPLATRESPVPMPTGGAAGGAGSLPSAPVLPIQYTSTAGMPTSLAGATSRLDEARHEAAEKEARLNQLLQSNVATEEDRQGARNDLAKAQQDELAADRSLVDAQNNLVEQQIRASEQSIGALNRQSDQLGQIGAQIDQDFGVSEGLPGIAENLTKFLANLAFAPVYGALTAQREAAGFSQGEAGVGITGMLASSGAFGDQFVPVPRWVRNGSGSTGGTTGSAPSALMPGFDNPNAAAMMSLAQSSSGNVAYAAASDLVNGLADCSGSISDLYEVLTTGTSNSGRQFTTTNFASDAEAAKLGFLPGYQEGALNVGVNPYPGQSGHMAATLPNGVNFEGGGGTGGGAQYGGSAAGALDPQFEKQYYLPLSGTGAGVGGGGGSSATTGGAASPGLYSPQNTSPGLTNPTVPGLSTNLPTGGLGLAGAPQGLGGPRLGQSIPGGPAAPSQTATGGRAWGQGQPASGGIGFNGGIIGAAASMAAGAAGGAGSFGAGGGAASAAADLGMQLIGRAIGAGGQYAGNAASGLLETFSLNGSALGDPSASWAGRLLGAAAGIRPALPNAAGVMGGKDNPNMAEAGKNPLTPQQAQQSALEAAGKVGGGGNTVNNDNRITVNNQRAREDGTGRDVQAAIMSGRAAGAPQR